MSNIKKAELEASEQGLLGAISQMRFNIGSQFYALATHLVSPHDFYVIPLEYRPHWSILYQAAEKCCPEELKNETVVIYHSTIVNTNVRGIIKSITDDKCTVYALDQGFQEDVDFGMLYNPLNEISKTAPPLIVHCELHMCCPKGGDTFSEESIEAFKYFMGNKDEERLKVGVVGNDAGKLKVKLYNSCADDMAMTLFFSGHTTFAQVNRFGVRIA